MNPHRAQFCRFLARGNACDGARPDASESFHPLRHHAVFGAGADDHFLQLAHELHRIKRLVFAIAAAESAQIQDGIPDQLPGTVVGDVAAAVDLKQIDAPALEFFF